MRAVLRFHTAARASVSHIVEVSAQKVDQVQSLPRQDDHVTNGMRAQWALQARAALIIAAMRRSILTYGELGAAIGISGVNLRNQLRHVLIEVSNECIERKEPSLAALVVNARTGQPGAGWRDGKVPWHGEVQQVFRYWDVNRRAAREAADGD